MSYSWEDHTYPAEPSLKTEYMKRQERQFFEAMRLDMEPEEKVASFREKEKMAVNVQRNFDIEVTGNK